MFQCPLSWWYFEKFEYFLYYISETIAFQAILTYNPGMSFGSSVPFDDVLLNEGDG